MAIAASAAASATTTVDRRRGEEQVRLGADSVASAWRWWTADRHFLDWKKVLPRALASVMMEPALPISVRRGAHTASPLVGAGRADSCCRGGETNVRRARMPEASELRRPSSDREFLRRVASEVPSAEPNHVMLYGHGAPRRCARRTPFDSRARSSRAGALLLSVRAARGAARLRRAAAPRLPRLRLAERADALRRAHAVHARELHRAAAAGRRGAARARRGRVCAIASSSTSRRPT